MAKKKDDLIQECNELGVELTGDETVPMLLDLIQSHSKENQDGSEEQDKKSGDDSENPEENKSGENQDATPDEKSGETFKANDSEGSEPELPSKVEEQAKNLTDEKVEVVGNKNFTTNDGTCVSKGKKCFISKTEYLRLTTIDKRGLVSKA